ncbi:rhodanese-like domain-containing protein [bacterium]|nr:rhodanese-like domain-containing protein [bacterium]
MKSNWLPKLGAAVLILFAGVLALMGNPTYLTPVQSVSEWGDMVTAGMDRVSPLTVSEWIVEDVPGMRIIDVRPQELFARFALPESENIPFDQLMGKAGLSQLSKHGKHVLVCKDGVRASQAWVVLRGMGYECYVLDGGANAWVDQILEGNAVDENPDLALKVHALREEFLGDGAAIGSAPPPPPAPAPVSIPAGGMKKKKSGGC